jgi:pimeloyl-ACP methyl ester carboxylesterase
MKLNLSRRMFGSHVSATAAGVALAACGASDATGSASDKRAVILVHGAWFGAWSYASITARLAAAGITPIAIDLPGHGLDAAFPASYFQRPLDQAAFATEPSPVGRIGVADYTTAILAAVDGLAAAGYERISLVGHSLAGVAITAAAEAAPQKIGKLIYLSAFMPVTPRPAGAYFGTPQGMQTQLTALLMSDFTQTGAARIDPNSADANYIAAMKSAFCADASDAAARAMMNMMSCDDPAQALGTPTGATAARWGSVPRAYIGCSQDKAVPPDLQSLFISEADGVTPQNKTVVQTLNSSHCPFLSQPATLAQMIATLAA